MFYKPIVCPFAVLQLEVLLQRLAQYHPERRRIEEDFEKRRSGFIGEQSMAYGLALISSEDIRIFHNLRIPLDNFFFQIDFLIITQAFILILEVKNHYGKLTYDQKNHQLTREKNGKTEVFEDPVLQVRTQRKQLKRWLKANNLPQLPIKMMITFTHPQVIIDSKHNDSPIPEAIFRKQVFSQKFHLLQANFNKELIDIDQLDLLSGQLLKADTPEVLDVLKKYNLSRDNIENGVFCPKCCMGKMCRKYATWKCLKCGYTEREAHLKALDDYAKIISNLINNRSARTFLQLDSSSIVKYLLSKTGWQTFGNSRNIKYIIPTGITPDQFK